MEIKTKYDIGDKVYCVWVEPDNIVRVVDDVISSIYINEYKKVLYYTEKIVAEEWKEGDLIPIIDHEALIESIDYLLERGYKDERDGNS